MLHPILHNRQNLLTYAIVWLIIGTINTILLLSTYNSGLAVSITESIIFNTLYAILGIGIWYPVYFTDLEKNKIANFITNHLASASLAVGIWLWLGIIILKSIYSNNTNYLEDLTSSVPSRALTGFLIYVLIAAIYYLFIYYQNFKAKLLRESELKALVKESELNSLKSQINPHFLFNSLNSISSLTMVSPEKAQDMVINLSNFLRYSLSSKNETLTTFEKELNNIDRYLQIEKIRFGKRLHVDQEIDESCYDRLLPGLILQPLIENAVKYGVYESIEKSNITIAARCSRDLLEVNISNDFDSDAISKKGEGIGLKNVASRMNIQYTRDDLLKIRKEGNIFKVILFFPQND